MIRQDSPYANGGYGPSADYCAAWQVALREAPGASMCSDPDCHLSGGYAHVGDCEPCSCGKEHAIAECPERRVRRVVFLDFDGTINGLETREPPSPIHAELFLNPVLVERVNQICERTGAVVVLSTSWRGRARYPVGHPQHVEIGEIGEALRLAGARFEVIGGTPDLARADRVERDGEAFDLWRAPERRKEIAAWVESHKPDAFVILDDDPAAEIAGHFVWCDPKRGLSAEGVEAAVRILEGR